MSAREPGAGALELRGVVKHYQAGDGTSIKAVDGVSLTVQAGEFTAVYGPSGSGKSTLLLLVAALMAPDAGEISFGGRDVSALSPQRAARYRRREIGVLLQAFHLTPGATAIENAALALLSDGWTLREASAAAEPWLERVGLGARLANPVDRLSMGERQRVALARALVSEPLLLLADEPTGNLDSRRGREVLSLLRELCHERQIPVLVVTHDPQASAFVDSIYTLRDGALRDGLDIDLAAVIGP